MKPTIRFLVLATIGLMAAGSLRAQYSYSTATTLSVGATIAAQCSVTTSPVAFGDMTAGDTITANGGVTVNCTNGLAYTIYLDRGKNGSYLINYSRSMSSGTMIVSYDLYRDSSYSLQWTDGTFGDIGGLGGVSGTGNDSAQAYTVYGKATIPPGDVIKPGLVGDTVIVTVSF